MRGSSGSLRLYFVLACAAAWACGSQNKNDTGFGGGGDDGGGSGSGSGSSGSSGSGGSSGGSGSGSSSGGLVGDGGSSGGNSNCSAAASYVYVIDAGGTLYKFDPTTLLFSVVGTVTCGGGVGSFSMSVDRNAVAWVLLQNGTIVKYDINAHTCTPTSYAMNQHNFQTFGMGFSADAPGSNTDTLFVSDSELTSPSTGGLAKIDTSSLTLTPVAQYDQLQGRRAEMTGTGDARLFGAFEGTPYVVAEIDKQTAHIKSTAPQTAISYPPDSSNFAFAFWGGDFWLFVGPGTSTDVFQYKPSTNTTTKRTTETFEIVGAGVSTCAPLTQPQ
jgi:hypothetical protein